MLPLHIKMPIPRGRGRGRARVGAGAGRRVGKRRFGAVRRPRVVVNRALHPIPQRFITKMKYSEAVNTDANGRFVFNLNSIYDPNRTGVGHQPYGFDTLATLYNRYRVIACGWRIQPAAAAVSAGTAFQIACMPANETLAMFTMSEMKENPRSKYVFQSVGGGIVTLSGKCYIPSLVGRTKAQYMADDRYQADVTTSPSELALLNILSATNGDTPAPLGIQVVLEYTVEFFDIKHLVQS